ncbi:hypothetical protein E8E11_001483 [Didymella keratinophila]|nr:hypothetical protein E8E11_001483 [Didymella keratinophila]
MGPHRSGYNSHGQGSSFDASRWRNNQDQPRTLPNRIQGTAQLDWQGLGAMRHAHDPQPPVGAQPNQQSQEPIILDEFAHLGASADLSQVLNPPFQSLQQQALSDTDHLGDEPLSQVIYGGGITETDVPDISARLCELARSEGILLDDAPPLSSQHQTYPSQPPPPVSQAEYAAQFSENPQPAVSDNSFAPVIYRDQFLSCFSEQRIIYMQAQLAGSIPYHEVFKGQHPLHWAILAHALEHAAPPRQGLANFEGSMAPCWLPSQADFRRWDAHDAEVLQAACLYNEIGVSWGLLDQMGTQAQLVLCWPPPVAPHGTQQVQDPPSQGMPSSALNQHLFQMEGQAYQDYPAEGLRELSSSRGDDRIEPADEPLQLHQSMEYLEDCAPLEPGALDKSLSQDGLFDQEASAPIPLSSQPSAHDASLQQTGAATRLSLPAQEAGEAQQNGEAAADPQPSANTATSATLFAQTQRPQQAPAAQNSQATKLPRKKKGLKRIVFDPAAILHPRSTDDAKIRLPREEDRATFTADISWFRPRDPVAFQRVPETDEELEPFVVYMLESMTDTSKAQDKKEPKSSFDKRWSKKALKEKSWPISLEAMEAICWIIVKMTMRYHRDGPAFLNLFDKLHQDRAEKNQDLTFVQRINVISTVLLISKSRVDTCLKHENLGSLVAFPLSVLADSKANRPNNEQRKATLAAGTEALKKKAEKEAKEAAAKKAAKEVTGDDQAAQEVEEEENGIENDEEKEKDEEVDVDRDDDDDENQDEDGSDDEDGDDDADNSTGSSQPGNEETDRDNGGQSGRAGDADTGTGASKPPLSNSHSHQAHAERAPAAAPTTEVDTRGPSKLPTIGLTASSAGALLQPQPPTVRATSSASRRAPAATSDRSRKRSAPQLSKTASSSKPRPLNGKVRRGPIVVSPAARTMTQNNTQVSFHSLDHLASIDAAQGSGPMPPPEPVDGVTRMREFGQRAASKSKGSRKRSATAEHLGLEQPSSPKRSRNASYAKSNDAAMYGTPGTITTPTVPPPTRTMAPPTSTLASPTSTPAPPMKRRAAEAGLAEANTREKSARSVVRQIIAPKRRRAPPSSEG